MNYRVNDLYLLRDCVLLRRLLVGGKWNNGASCGSRSVNGNNLSANRNGNNGSRLVADTWILLTRIPKNPKAGSFILADKKAKNKGSIQVASSRIKTNVICIKKHNNTGILYR